ncbi:hypothetical protein CEXT_73161 [Caerostris extrusa]|uniref:Uncharacterized protein n=1 Tax=Caerostris extrusa TaxID=172846 RepID=A0AAV4XKX0_CAEEX|nr:hypothetical protein CEXT_73161 [Caerostris extrusa]
MYEVSKPPKAANSAKGRQVSPMLKPHRHVPRHSLHPATLRQLVQQRPDGALQEEAAPLERLSLHYTKHYTLRKFHSFFLNRQQQKEKILSDATPPL